MATIRESGAIAKKQLALRNLHWPEAAPSLWHRTANKGFATIPKTMPMILKIMDEMTKGAPVSSTYLTLWCSTWDNSFVVLNKHGDMANAAGFGGQRGEHTWATRMKKLKELHFIDIKPGKSGPMSNAIIWNPHLVLRWHHGQKTPGLTEEKVREYCRANLTGYKQPKVVEFRTDLPKTPVGKILRRELRDKK